ncbi:MAG TPA: DpnI domain-containing protein [Candidatus Acidoferrum sp.]|nr:DpnI domain-containing protein [Candidatus Acidoferrum sp.]
MDLHLPTQGLESYKSASQRARISSESWASRELYCPRCTANRLDQLPGNTPVIDFRCPHCESGYQLKSGASAFHSRLTDGAYAQMHAAILHGRTPNLFLLHYQLNPLTVSSLTFIPDFAFTLSALERRKPLAATARRAGWIGCNILLNRIPTDARILLVKDSCPVPAVEARRAFRKLKPLASLKAEKRGWTLDVLNAVRSLNKREFSLAEIYSLDSSLARLHPRNSHIRPKIRQQLQVLRDLGLLIFLGDGSYLIT